jgi:hypothetical protein
MEAVVPDQVPHACQTLVRRESDLEPGGQASFGGVHLHDDEALSVNFSIRSIFRYADEY